MSAATHVVCFGNIWQGDDGLGMHVFERLRRRRDLPRGVRVLEGGVAGLAAAPLFAGCAKAIVVDALRSGAAVGRVVRLARNELAGAEASASLHGLGVNELLALLPLHFRRRALPEVVVIGAEIGAIRPFTSALSPEVEAAVEGVIGAVRSECAQPRPPRGARAG
jgi:hydrogenase maturation protease